MNDILVHLKSQPIHVLLVYVALLIGALMLFIIASEFIKNLFGLNKSKRGNNKGKTTSRSSRSSKSKYSQGKSRFSCFKRGSNKGSSIYSSKSKKGFGFFKKDNSASKMRSRSINGYDYGNKGSSATKLSRKLDFLSPQSECITSFKHGKVNGSFKELRKAGPASNLKDRDIDDLDETFTIMLKAGAVKKKTFLVTDFEHQYLEKLRIWFGDRYEIYCQVSVGSALGIDPDVSNLPLQDRRTFAQKCHNMSFDFMLIERGTDRIACVVELDDPTHLRGDRMARDRRLDKVCAAADLPIFHITALNQKPDLKGI